MPPRACTGSTRIAPILSRRKNWRIWNSTVGKFGPACGKLHEDGRIRGAATERAAKKIAVRGVERAVAESVIRAFKRDDAAFAGGEHGGFERGFDGFKTGVGENGFASCVIVGFRTCGWL